MQPERNKGLFFGFHEVKIVIGRKFDKFTSKPFYKGLKLLSQSYLILLEGKKIGTTSLEKADVPMGVVFGKINFINIESGYSFFKEHCLKNGIIFEDYPEAKLISTNNIPNLKIFATDGLEIKGLSNSISGMETD